MVCKIKGMTEDDAKKHKKPFTNIEINVPVAIENFFENYVKTCNHTAHVSMAFCKHTNFHEIRRIHDQLKENFERECCDLEFYSRPDVVYLIVTSLLGPGYKKTKKYRYIGFVEVKDFVIQVCWIHPFYRNKGLMKTFLNWYAFEEGILAFQPPISRLMQHCLEKVQEEIINNSEILKRQVCFSRQWLKIKSPLAEIDRLTDKEVFQVKSGVEAFLALSSKRKIELGEGDVFTNNINKVIEMNTKTLLFLKEHPEALEDAKDYLKKKSFGGEVEEALQHFRDHGFL